MQEQILIILPLIAPFTLLLYALVSWSGLFRSSDYIKTSSIYLAVVGIAVSLVSAAVVFKYGTIQSTLLGYEGLGFSTRLDPLSVTMFVMISILGFVILKFSGNYLDGDSRKMVFFNRLSTTIASVELLILSGNLFQILVFWIITSVCLHYLLVFYRNRPQAIAAARKKFIVARAGDLSLGVAIWFIYLSSGTGELSQIFAHIESAGVLDGFLIWASIFLVITAILKSAQFPTHGWLIEVVETPTPVSALLHAGLLNAGPFLMARLGFLMIESTPASIMLIIIGGFTAMFASVVFLTQPSIKISLGYSSVAHMGFSLLLCGLGVYSAAILHVVAHSFYKAHAFLSSGSIVEVMRAKKVLAPERMGSVWRITLSVLLALAMYGAVYYLWNIRLDESFSLMIVGVMIVLGLSQIIATTVDARSNWKAMLWTGGIALLVLGSFFTFEHGARVLLSTQIPELSTPALAIQWVSIALVAVYTLIVLAQVSGFKIKESALGYRLGVHLRNGLYANVIFDRIIGSLKNEKFKWVNLAVKEEKEFIEMNPGERLTLPEKEILLSN
ncbi:proton-conducting transporter membrane subunit [Ekhidna sp.]|uniref:proton-conducting transporter transmembrane domain-containing protein n=1 Tax=Ekhidna sp. TaxID=2608089 RepID=UPI003B5C01E0